MMPATSAAVSGSGITSAAVRTERAACKGRQYAAPAAKKQTIVVIKGPLTFWSRAA